jgi:hypothetical protein
VHSAEPVRNNQGNEVTGCGGMLPGVMWSVHADSLACCGVYSARRKPSSSSLTALDVPIATLAEHMRTIVPILTGNQQVSCQSKR